MLGNNLGQLFANDVSLTNRVGENRLVVNNQRFELGCLVDDLLALERCELTKLHVQDCASLQLVNRKQLDQTIACIFDGCALANQCDNSV